jgi:hypothetical protein
MRRAMTARGESVTYEVRLEVDEAIAAEVDAWLGLSTILSSRFHRPKLHDAPLPVPADDKVRRTVPTSSRAVTRSPPTFAITPRACRDGVKRFGERMRATRRVLEAVDAAKLATSAAARTATRPDRQYCAECGQRDRSRMISLWELITDFAGEFFDLDSRFWRTLFPLVFSPGRLTAEYLRGRRALHAAAALYVISSVVFFLLATVGGVNGDLQIGGDNDRKRRRHCRHPARPEPAPEEEGHATSGLRTTRAGTGRSGKQAEHPGRPTC